MYPVHLSGIHVVLREFRLEDTPDTLQVVGDPAVTHYLSFDSKDTDAARAMTTGIIERAKLEPRTEYYLAVADFTDDGLLGFARLGLDGVNAGKLGYAIRRADWRKGYASNAARLLIDFGFAKLGLHRISAAIGPDNAASLALIDKLGFTYEGRIRDHVFTNGAWRDSLLYSVLESEWAGGSRGTGSGSVPV